MSRTDPITTPRRRRNDVSSNVDLRISELMDIQGALVAALVDHDSGMVLASSEGADLDVELAAAGNSDVVRAQQRTMEALGVEDRLEDVLITLGTQYHLIRPMNEGMFLYLVLDRSRANLALARRRLTAVSLELVV